MSKKITNLSELGHRLCDFARSAGCEVSWRHSLGITSDKCHLLIIGETTSWCSKLYADTVSGKKRAFREFAKFVLSPRSSHFYTTALGKALSPVLRANSPEELDVKLAVMGF